LLTLDILKQRTTDVALKEYAVAYMRDVTKSFDYCKQQIFDYEGRARAFIKGLSPEFDSSKLEAIVTKLIFVR
jgi:geranylgeranyl diphosphate synthase type 3